MTNAQKIDDLGYEQNFADELAPGSTLMHGQYTINSFLNAGGFGITYSARDSLDRAVVIKECFPGSFCRRSQALVHARSRAHTNELASIVRLFVQEARSLSKLKHPNIVGVHHVFEENNTAYMALDYVEGRDLLEVIERPEEEMTPAQVESILRKLLDAIGYIHDQGVLHRDISPDNILLDNRLNPILIDFGAAREEASKQSRVLSAMRVVKDGYSPQEFYISGSEQGPYSDLYALGATFYHLITGELPIASQTRLSAIAGGEADPYTPLAGRVVDYSDNFLAAIDQALEVLPQDRISSAQMWLAMLNGHSKIVQLRDPDPIAQAIPEQQKTSKSKKGVLLASVTLIVGMGFVITQFQSGSSEKAEATTETPVVEESLSSATPEGSSADILLAAGAGAASDPASDIELGGALLAAGETAAAADGDGLDALNVDAMTLSASTDGFTLTGTDTAAVEAEDTSIVLGDVAALDAALPGIEVEDGASSADLVLGSAALIETPVVLETATTDLTIEAHTTDVAALDLGSDLVVTNDASEASTSLTETETGIASPDVTAVVLPETVDTLASLIEGIAPAAPSAEDTVALAITTPSAPASDGFDVSGMLSGWVVDLPEPGIFATDFAGDKIFSVNGTPVETRFDFDSALRDTMPAPVGSEVEFTVSYGPSQDSATDQTWVLPVRQKTVLLNGFAFETAPVDGAWETTVTMIPGFQTEDLRANDVVAGSVSDSVRFDQRDSFAMAVEKAISSGATVLPVAVMRDGTMTVVSLPLPNDKLASND